MLLHVVGHVEHDEGVLVAEHELGERLGEERFADAGRADEDERAHRALGVFEPGACAADGLGDGLDCLVLRDDLFVQLVLELEQALGLLLLEAGEGDAGHLGDDLGDDFVVDDTADLFGLLAPFLLDGFFLFAELLGLVAEFGGLFVVRVLDRVVLLDREVLDVGLDVREVRRLGHRLESDAGAGFVDDIDGLVGLDPAGDVPGGKLDGCFDRGVGDLHAVVVFVAAAEALEDEDGLLGVGRVDGDGLEATRQGGVLLDVLAVLVEGCRADALDLAACEGGLEDVGRVDRALGAAGADQCVQLVDEEDDVLALGPRS